MHIPKSKKLKLLSLPLALYMSAVNAVQVDTELVLLIDVSGSVNDIEYSLQKTGYSNAFRSAAVLSAIESVGSIAATYVEWSGATQQSQLVGWTMINDQDSANNFANLIDQTVRAYSGYTAPGSAIDYGVTLFGTETNNIANGYESLRQVIDISGDGKKNSGTDVQDASDAAIASGVEQINGLPIGRASIANYYNDQVVNGENSFYMAAYQFADVQQSLVSKLQGEITDTIPIDANILPPSAKPPADVAPVPIPAAGYLFGFALVSMAGIGRKRSLGKTAN